MKNLLIFISFFLIYSNINAQNLSKQDSSDIDKLFYFYKGNCPGAVLGIYKGDKVLFEKAYGSANIETKDRITLEHSFYFTAMGKVFTTLAIMKIVEKGDLSLDDRLVDLIPNLPDAYKEVKLRNLLSHTSGIVNFNDAQSNDDVIKFLRSTDSLMYPVGDQWKYSNSDYVLLASIIEEVSGKSYPNYISKYIFKKIKTSGNHFSSNVKVPELFCHKAKDQYTYELIGKVKKNKIWGERNISLTLDDFKKLNSAYFSNKTFLKKETNDKIFERITVGDNIKNNFGLGWYVIQDKGQMVYWIAGNDNAFENVWVHLPEYDITVLLITNRNQSQDHILKKAIYIANKAKE